MSDIQRLGRIAGVELELTERAFDELRARYVADALKARTPDDAYEGVLSVRVLDSVRASLRAVIDTALIETTTDDANDAANR